MLGTPMTMRLPPCPPDANKWYSSFLPLGMYVFSAAVTSGFVSPRAFAELGEIRPQPAVRPVDCRKTHRSAQAQRGQTPSKCSTVIISWLIRPRRRICTRAGP